MTSSNFWEWFLNGVLLCNSVIAFMIRGLRLGYSPTHEVLRWADIILLYWQMQSRVGVPRCALVLVDIDSYSHVLLSSLCTDVGGY